jgi:uncharacterized protein (TIGR02996 family)
MFCTGCQGLAGLGSFEPAPTAADYWAQGQAAMHRGMPLRAISFYHLSLERGPEAAQTHLSLAAAHLELGDRARASHHLAHYVAAHPDDGELRSRYADLLWQLGAPEARAEFERSIEIVQDQEETADSVLIHCHSRLMEMAEAGSDAYGEHLHRGIGLYLLGRAAAGTPEADAELPSEGLLCKAAGELTLARAERPDEARPSWYLYQVWSTLSQRLPARRCLEEARELAPFTYLTPAEQRSLLLARQATEPVRAPK